MKRFMILVAALFLTACEDAIEPEHDKISATVKDCDVWFVENASSPDGQKRMRVFAASSAKGGLERAATASYLAYKAIELTNFDYAEIFLVPNNLERDRSELSATEALAWVKYTPTPEKIPFMEQSWVIEYRLGETQKVIDEYGHKEYEFESFTMLNEILSLNIIDDTCDPTMILHEVENF